MKIYSGTQQDVITVPIDEAMPVLLNRSEQQRRDRSVILFTNSAPNATNEVFLTLELAAAMTPADTICCHGVRSRQRMLEHLEALGKLVKEKFDATRFPTINLVALPPSVDSRQWRKNGEMRGSNRRDLGMADQLTCVGLDWSVLKRACYEDLDVRRLVICFMEIDHDITLLVCGCRAEVTDQVEAFLVLLSRHAPGVTVRCLGGDSEDIKYAVAASDIWLVPAPAAPDDLLPAMASGRATISIDWDWTVDLIDDGRTGLSIPAFAPLTIRPSEAFLEPNYVSSLVGSTTFASITLAEKLLSLINDPEKRESMGRAAAREMESRFDDAVALERFGALRRQLTTARKAVQVSAATPMGPAGKDIAERRVRNFVTAPITPMVYLRGVGRQTHSLVADLINSKQLRPNSAPASVLIAIGNLFTAVDSWLVHDVLTVVGGETENGMTAIQTLVRAGILSPIAALREPGVGV